MVVLKPWFLRQRGKLEIATSTNAHEELDVLFPRVSRQHQGADLDAPRCGVQMVGHVFLAVNVLQFVLQIANMHS